MPKSQYIDPGKVFEPGYIDFDSIPLCRYDKTIEEEKLPITMTSYSPCFRKEKGAHGIEERGV